MLKQGSRQEIAAKLPFLVIRHLLLVGMTAEGCIFPLIVVLLKVQGDLLVSACFEISEHWDFTI